MRWERGRLKQALSATSFLCVFSLFFVKRVKILCVVIAYKYLLLQIIEMPLLDLEIKLIPRARPDFIS